jgi:hypothetical protein
MPADYDRTADFRFDDGSTYKSFNGKEYNSIEQIRVLILGFSNSMIVGLSSGDVGAAI